MSVEPIRRFQVEPDDDAPQKAPGEDATKLMLLALASLSKRAIIALESCFSLITVAFTFWLASSILAAPSTNQLIGLGVFSAFVLIANWLVLKRAR